MSIDALSGHLFRMRLITMSPFLLEMTGGNWGVTGGGKDVQSNLCVISISLLIVIPHILLSLKEAADIQKDLNLQ